MKAQGQLEPIVLTTDNIILSGHRRRAAAMRLGWRTIKVRYHEPPISFGDADFEKVLVSYNRQRDKDPSMRIREELVLTDPDNAYIALVSERVRKAAIKVDTLELGSRRPRYEFSMAKVPFLRAIQDIVHELEDYWPLSDRLIHYALLNYPPLRNCKKPGSRYAHVRIPVWCRAAIQRRSGRPTFSFALPMGCVP
jgi:hypothetical protein